MSIQMLLLKESRCSAEPPRSLPFAARLRNKTRRLLSHGISSSLMSSSSLRWRRESVHTDALQPCKIISFFLNFKVLGCPFSLREGEGKRGGAGTSRAVFPVLGPRLETEK